MKPSKFSYRMPFFVLVGVASFFQFNAIGDDSEPTRKSGAESKGNEKQELVVLTPHQLRHPRAMGRIERQTRGADPFGVAMTHESAAAQRVMVRESEVQDTIELPKAENILDEAVKKITIRGVKPQSKIVMIGARAVGVGQILAIKHEGVLFRLRLDDVTVRSLELTDLVTKEKIMLPLNILPESFTRMSSLKGGSPAPPTGASRIASTVIIE